MRISQTPPAALIATHAAIASALHGITGTLVGTTDVQTLTNKTITNLAITNEGVGADPTLASNYGSQKVRLSAFLSCSGTIDTGQDIILKSSTAFSLTLAHAITANRIATFPDKDIMVAGIVDLQEHLMIGAGNAKWIPMVFAGDLNAITGVNRGFYHTGQYWGNQSADNSSISFMLGIPLTLGALNLYVKAVRYELIGANATNKVTAIYAYKNQTEIDTDATDRTSAAVYTLTFSAAESLVGFEIFALLIDCVLADIDTLKISHAEVEVYYA